MSTNQSNDQIIFDRIIDEQRAQRLPAASEARFFEIYASEQVLKDYDLSDEEIDSGLVGNGGDGGIDSIYIFVNGEIALEDFDSSQIKKSIIIELVIIQSKRGFSFDEDSMNKLVCVSRDLLDFSKQIENFKSVYNEGVRSAFQNFRKIYNEMASRFPRLNFKYIYASRGDSKAVHPNVSRKIDDLKQAVTGCFSSAKIDFDFYGASDLLELARKQPVTSYSLEIVETLSVKNGYIALVRLDNFNSFLCDENKQLRKPLFEANVRDYQGDNQVNEAIQKSLQEKGKEDFWWLNNGITIVATQATQSSKTLTLEDPQIVNGQQTSTEIFNHFQESNSIKDERCVMLRIIVATAPESRDKIIKATNSQTGISAASLRATDKIHRDIEDYFSPHKLYYDRRKNSQKNQGKPIGQIIGISMLAQAIMAIVLQRPDNARARPSSLLKRDEDYVKVFSSGYPMGIYLVSAKIIKSTKLHLIARNDLDEKNKTNILFYVAMHLVATLCGAVNPTVDKIAALDVETISSDQIEKSIGIVYDLFSQSGASDQVAKGPTFLEVLKTVLRKDFPDQGTLF